MVFLVLGCFLDVSVLLLVFVPMLLGVDLVHFGVLVVLNTMIGLIHPPFGILLFVTKALTGIPIGEMMKEGRPFLVMLLLLLMAITVFSQIVLWLPHTMGSEVRHHFTDFLIFPTAQVNDFKHLQRYQGWNR